MDAVTLALIKSMAGNGGGGGSSLPYVTSADNGKVLTVEDGAWAADSNLLVITRSGSSIDKTTTEVKDAIDSGKCVVLANGTDLMMYCGQSNSEWYFTSCPTGNNIRYGSIIKSSGYYSGGTFPKLMNVNSSDNGSELIVKSGAWAKQQKKFVVTLTPTALDYSGTMDKTPAEITAAYNAGQEIVFDIPALGAKINATQFRVVADAIVAGCMVYYNVNTSPVIITVATASSASTYATQVFAMTPAS